MEVRIWNFVAELELPDNNTGVHSNPFSKEQNSLLRIERPHAHYEAIQLWDFGTKNSAAAALAFYFPHEEEACPGYFEGVL